MQIQRIVDFWFQGRILFEFGYNLNVFKARREQEIEKKKVFEMKWVKEKAENEMIHIRLSINISLNE